MTAEACLTRAQRVLVLTWSGLNNACWRALQELSMSVVFVLGYLAIIVEDVLALNKAGIALMMAVALWAIRADGSLEVCTTRGRAISVYSSKACTVHKSK